MPGLTKKTALKSLFAACGVVLLGMGGYYVHRVRAERIVGSRQWLAGRHEVAFCHIGNADTLLKVPYRGADSNSKNAVAYGFLDGDCKF